MTGFLWLIVGVVAFLGWLSLAKKRRARSEAHRGLLEIHEQGDGISGIWSYDLAAMTLEVGVLFDVNGTAYMHYLRRLDGPVWQAKETESTREASMTRVLEGVRCGMMSEEKAEERRAGAEQWQPVRDGHVGKLENSYQVFVRAQS